MEEGCWEQEVRGTQGEKGVEDRRWRWGLMYINYRFRVKVHTKGVSIQELKVNENALLV